MYKTVLLAYDGSVEGVLALREGALLARTCGARVVLLSIVPHGVGLAMAEGVYGGAVNQQIGDYKDLLKQAVAWLDQRGFAPEARLIVGEPAPTIGKVASEVLADLVVVGRKRQNFLSRWWSGSTRAYLSDNVDCSLLLACNPMTDEAFDAALRKLSPA